MALEYRVRRDAVPPLAREIDVRCLRNADQGVPGLRDAGRPGLRDAVRDDLQCNYFDFKESSYVCTRK